MDINIDEELLLKTASILVQRKPGISDRAELKKLWPYFAEDPDNLALLWQTVYDAQLLELEAGQSSQKSGALFAAIMEPISEGFQILPETLGLSFLDLTRQPAFRSAAATEVLQSCNAIRIIEEPFQAIFEIDCEVKSNQLRLCFTNRFSSEGVDRVEIASSKLGTESTAMENNKAYFEIPLTEDTEFFCYACTNKEKAEVTGFKLSIKPAER